MAVQNDQIPLPEEGEFDKYFERIDEMTPDIEFGRGTLTAEGSREPVQATGSPPNTPTATQKPQQDDEAYLEEMARGVPITSVAEPKLRRVTLVKSEQIRLLYYLFEEYDAIIRDVIKAREPYQFQEGWATEQRRDKKQFEIMALARQICGAGKEE